MRTRYGWMKIKFVTEKCKMYVERRNVLCLLIQRNHKRPISTTEWPFTAACGTFVAIKLWIRVCNGFLNPDFRTLNFRKGILVKSYWFLLRQLTLLHSGTPDIWLAWTSRVTNKIISWVSIHWGTQAPCVTKTNGRAPSPIASRKQ